MPSKKPKSKKGRPVGTTTKLTPAVQEGICAALKIGVPAKYAAERQGIPERTYYDWLAKGEQGIQPYHDFALAVMRATAEAVCYLTARALAGGSGAAQSTWMLEHRFPREYAQRTLGREARADDGSLAEHLRLGTQIRSSPEASRLMHEALAVSVADQYPSTPSNDIPHSELSRSRLQ
jgi:hypothetical protein